MHSKFMQNLVLVFLLLSVSSCGADGSTDASQIAANETVATSEVAPEDSANNSENDAKAQFTATLLSGATFDSSKVLETQPLALWFWAPG